MKPRHTTHRRGLLEVWCSASGEQDYTHKQAAGQSCLSGQWTNWIICEHLRVMGWSAGSDPLACVFLSCLTARNESNRLWRWCARSGVQRRGRVNSRRDPAEQSRRRNRLFDHLTGSNVPRRGEKTKDVAKKKQPQKTQQQLKTQKNVPLFCDEVALMRCAITNRSYGIQAWHYSHMLGQRWIG